MIRSTLLFTLAASFLLASCDNNSMMSGKADLNSMIDSVSYSLGYQNGKFLKDQGMDDIDLDLMLSAIYAGMNEEETALSMQEMQQVVQSYQMQKQQETMAKRQQQAEENKKKGEAFLAENGAREEVTTTESGLQYEVLEEGTGDSPAETDTVVVHYEGTLMDGDVFDSSYEREQPATFPLNRVIPGWTEGVQLMKEGAKYKFYIPSELAYKSNPQPGSKIGPNETLIFEVELIEVKN